MVLTQGPQNEKTIFWLDAEFFDFGFLVTVNSMPPQESSDV